MADSQFRTTRERRTSHTCRDRSSQSSGNQTRKAGYFAPARHQRGGCSGFSYVIEFHDGPPRPKDLVFDFTAEDGTPVRVVVDPKSILYLGGTELEWEQTLMQQGFKFINPHEKTSCGCGHSFTV